MKCKDIFEINVPYQQRHVKNLPKYWKMDDSPHARRMDKNPKVKHMGSGAFASTYRHEDRPEDVTKITKPMQLPDGYQRYLRMLLTHDDYDNPYFPRIRNVKELRKGKANVMQVKTESLRKLKELSRDDANAVLDRWLGNKKKAVLRDVFHWDRGLPEMTRGYEYVISNLLKEMFKDPLMYRGIIVDKDLERAIRWIKMEVAKDRVETDISPNNIMFKRSPYGIQVVLTDPVA